MATPKFSPVFAIPPVECARCKVLGATFVCATCGTFYCNVPCQIEHWPIHKDVCMPRLVMATPLMGTALRLEECISQVYPITPNTVNEKVSPTSMGPSPSSVVPIIPSSTGKSVLQQTVLENGTTTCKSPSNEEKAQQQKTKPVIESANDMAPKSSAVVAEHKVEKNGHKVLASAMEKANQQKPELIPKNVGDTSVKSATVVPEQTVQNNSQKAVDSGSAKPSLNVEKLQQQKEILKNLNSTNAKISKTDAGMRKANTENCDPKPDRTYNDELLQQGPFPEPGSNVKISYVADDKIYIYETGPGPNGERNGVELLITRSLECARSVKQTLSAPPIVGDIVFAAFDGDYYRAVIKSVKNDSAEVFYPDFGNSQTVQWNTLKEIPDPKLKYANCLTHGVWLENIAAFTPSIKEFLTQLENIADFKLISVIEVQNAAGIKMVEMYNCSERYNLSLKLQELQATQSIKKKPLPAQLKSTGKISKFVVTNPNTYKPVQIHELVDAGSIQGTEIELVIANASSVFTDNQFSVMTKSNFELYKTMMQECEMYGRIDPNPYVPKANELCLVHNNGIWYRAATIEPDTGGSNLLYLVDDLCFAEDKDMKIRRYPPGLTRHQFVVECVLENTDILLGVIDGKEDVDALCGKLIKANVHLLKDEEMYETTHVTIVNITK
ncbi:uncharacterized protein LOC128708630 [Anopheles marshallii]|uniref:uncharacterized protein LOC128708630 n=1 Tax=Anopheles marshallii TaxID=1521116 RepID=UPI00237B97B2|nr:uncharacterized protein LOC128708630 [Anopheles marshallii]